MSRKTGTKTKTRERMARTGESYTAALAGVRLEQARALGEAETRALSDALDRAAAAPPRPRSEAINELLSGKSKPFEPGEIDARPPPLRASIGERAR